MTPAQSVRDSLLVARFELLRNLRTWRALALCGLYLMAVCGGTWIFTRLLLTAENAVASTLNVPATETPGALIDKVMELDTTRSLLVQMLGNPEWMEDVVKWPVLAIFHLWLAGGIIPFLAASVAGECVAVDSHSRALRYELLRTGRLEVVSGRLIGQAILMLAAALLSVVGTYAVGMYGMVGQDPARVLGHLLLVTPRVWVMTLPFLGIGVTCSLVGESPNISRVIAMTLTMLSFALAAIGDRLVKIGHWSAPAWDVINTILPQTWIDRLWEPGLGWLQAAMILTVLGFAGMCLALPWFMRRDL